jgi:hypothetical protein
METCHGDAHRGARLVSRRHHPMTDMPARAHVHTGQLVAFPRISWEREDVGTDPDPDIRFQIRRDADCSASYRQAEPRDRRSTIVDQACPPPFSTQLRYALYALADSERDRVVCLQIYWQRMLKS